MCTQILSVLVVMFLVMVPGSSLVVINVSVLCSHRSVQYLTLFFTQLSQQAVSPLPMLLLTAILMEEVPSE